MVAETLAIETAFENGGVRYAEAAGALSVLLAPKRKNRWHVAVRQGEAVLDGTVMDPADRTQREKFLKGLELTDGDQEALRRLLLYAALNAVKDTTRCLAWQVDEQVREIAERQEQDRQIEQARRQVRVTEAWEAGHTVLSDPSLLYQIGEVAKKRGLAGEGKTVRLLYLVFTSRKRRRPINGVLKGGSSGGKSFLVAITLDLFPPDAYWELTAMSAKSLVYTQENFAHRHIVIYEHVGSEDGDYLVRTLQSEGRLRYLVTEKQPDGTFAARFIEKDGPTGFVTTTTKAQLHPENETRLWTLPIDESEEQTDAVVRSVASRYGSRDPEPDLRSWRSAQDWLGLAGVGEAHIPYSLWLAERLPKKPLRIRRDADRLLALIETSAVLFQAQREIGPDGRVLATVHDYANAYVLADQVFRDALFSVPKRTRELLEIADAVYQQKVQADPEAVVTYKDLITATGLDKSALSKALAPAFKAGVLENLEGRNGVAARLRPHLDLLGTVAGLPTPEELAAEFPRLAAGVWVHPLTGERKNLSPPTPRNGGNGHNGVRAGDVERAGTVAGVVATVETGPTNENGTVVTVSTVPGELDEKLFPPTQFENGLACEATLPEATATPPDDPETGDHDSERLSGEAEIGDAGVSLISPEQVVITSADSLRAALPDLLAAPVVGLDLETTGLDPLSHRTRLIQLAIPGRAFVIDCFRADARPLAPLFDGTRTLVLHNGTFDLGFLAAAGLPIPPGGNLFDTMLAAQLLGAGTPEGRLDHSGLAVVVGRYLGVTLDKSEQKGDWGGELSTDQLRYAAQDAAVLLPLYDRLRAELKAAGLERVAALEMRCLPAVVWLEQAGAPFDAERWRALSDSAVKRVVILERELTTLAGTGGLFDGIGSINWGAPKQVLKLLRGRGHQIECADEAALTALLDKEPLAAPLLEHREASKLASAYGIEFAAKHVHRATGRIHPDYLQLGAASGRMSCTTPNLQQVPRDPQYRACFRPPEGRVLVKGDFSQIELRIAAEIAEDARMLDAFERGDDLHALTAALVLGRSNGQVRREDRQAAKAVNFGLLYGMGPDRLQEHALGQYGVRLTEAGRFRERFFETYLGLRGWHRAQPRGVIETRTLAGRRRLGVERFTEKLNTPIQGTGADGLKAALALLWETRDRCPSAVPILAVHDEIVLEVDAAEAEQAAAWLTDCMTRGMSAFLRRVPVAVEAKIMRDWSGTPLDAPDPEAPEPSERRHGYIV